MQEPLAYSLDHAYGTVELSLTSERFIVRTQGIGLIDKPRTIYVPLSDLKNFCLVSTIAFQNIIGRTDRRKFVYDDTYDSEFIFSYQDHGTLKKKRVLVNRHDEMFQRLLEALGKRCPAASLLHLEPGEAQKQIGVISGSQVLYITIGVIIGVPVVSVLIFIISMIFHNYR
jgi:hypothetical protein